VELKITYIGRDFGALEEKPLTKDITLSQFLDMVVSKNETTVTTLFFASDRYGQFSQLHTQVLMAAYSIGEEICNREWRGEETLYGYP